MDDIESYNPQSSQILEVDGGWIEAFFAGEMPNRGEAIAITPDSADHPPIYGVVRTHKGGRRVEAMLVDRPSWVEPGCSVERTQRPTHVVEPEGQKLDLDADSLVPADRTASSFPLAVEPPSFSDIDGDRPALEIEWDPIDTFAPLVRGGLNLIIDAESDSTLFDWLCGRVLDRRTAELGLTIASPASKREDDRDWDRLVVPPSGDHGRFVGLRVGTGWASHLRDQARDLVVGAHLPTPRSASRRSPERDPNPKIPSLGGVVDRLASRLVSTRRGTITSLVRLPVADSPAGFETIVETLDLGDVDAQILFDSEGTFQPRRSTSEAEIEGERRERRDERLACLRQADQLRDKRQIMGPTALTERETELLERAERIEDQCRKSS